MTVNPQITLEKTIEQAATQCVKCGLCLPHCPTYLVTENECESPRGRIALADALAKQQIPLTAKTQTYLNHCLTCRACEVVCPAHVPYGQLIDNTRELMAKAGKNLRVPYLLAKAFWHPWLFRWGARLVQFYQYSGLQWLTQKTGLLRLFHLNRSVTLLPRRITTQRWPKYSAAKTAKQGVVALFTGCVNQLVDQTTIIAALQVLTACGYDVIIPPSQRCCGALYQHAGQTDAAHALAQRNLQAFALAGIDAIITFTSGCGAFLQEYANVLNQNPAQQFSQRVMDISYFLMSINWPKNLQLKPLAKRVALHTPCTLKNVVKQGQAPHELLKKIPGLDVLPLVASTPCCGAAGLYMLEHPEMAAKLVDNVLSQVKTMNPDYLITSNLGCALQIGHALRENKLAIPIKHPITLIAEQL